MSFEDTLDQLIRRAIREEMQAARAPAAEPDELLSVKRAAELADVSPATIKRWVKEGRLKRYGSARAVRVRRGDVLNLQPASDAGDVDLDALAKKVLG